MSIAMIVLGMVLILPVGYVVLGLLWVWAFSLAMEDKLHYLTIPFAVAILLCLTVGGGLLIVNGIG
jgi:hypothetical protein